ncbi:hypothetical protein SUGI_0116100 [Cryptomeria japonica]|nr:hypothetical protein SUGI_0116100 [Cryptomeria japonica]
MSKRKSCRFNRESSERNCYSSLQLGSVPLKLLHRLGVTGEVQLLRLRLLLQVHNLSVGPVGAGLRVLFSFLLFLQAPLVGTL